MKKVKLIAIAVVVVGLIVALVIFYNPLMAKMYHGKMKGFELRQGQSIEQAVNEGINGFIGMGGSAIPFLVSYLDTDKDDGVRIGSAIALGKIGATAEGTRSLLRALERGSSAELNAVIWALSQQKKTMTKDVVKVLKTSRNEQTRVAAIKILTKIADKSASPDVAAALRDSSINVVKAAASSLSIIPYPEATGDLIDAIRRIAPEKDSNALSSACSALIASKDDRFADIVFAELGRNDVMPLLDASREYAKRLSISVLLPYLKTASLSENPIERESALIVASALTAEGKEQVAAAALSDTNPATVISALEMLKDVGTAATVEKVINLISSNDKEIGSAALVTMGKIVDRTHIGDAPSITTDPRENPRDEYIIVAIDCLKDPNLRIAAAKSLEIMSRQNGDTTYEFWSGWWEDFKNTSGLVRELNYILANIDLEHKTKEAFEKAGPQIKRAEEILERLSDIAIRNPKIAAWVDKKQQQVNQLRYVYNKSKPLDIMH